MKTLCHKFWYMLPWSFSFKYFPLSLSAYQLPFAPPNLLSSFLLYPVLWPTGCLYGHQWAAVPSVPSGDSWQEIKREESKVRIFLSLISSLRLPQLDYIPWEVMLGKRWPALQIWFAVLSDSGKTSLIPLDLQVVTILLLQVPDPLLTLDSHISHLPYTFKMCSFINHLNDICYLLVLWRRHHFYFVFGPRVI